MGGDSEIGVQPLKLVLGESSMPSNYPKEALDLGRDDGEPNGEGKEQESGMKERRKKK